MQEENPDCYFIDGGYMVFTKAYHLKRGNCCKNACRHCPWIKQKSADVDKSNLQEKQL